jgi:quercetin dioxygenase-like cupin family protein
MRILSEPPRRLDTITSYDSRGASARRVADGSGEAHAYVVRFEPGGVIGRHEAGFAQLFIVLEGGGWVAGDDDRRVAIAAGDIVMFDRGEHHAKGSESGMLVVMVQVRDMRAVTE